MAFCHLHVHSEYSLLDGANPIKKLVARAKELGHEHLALTDHGNLLGAYEFFTTCQAEEIHPVIGCEVYVVPDRTAKEGTGTGKRAWHLLLLAENQEGYKNLMRLVSLGYTEGFYYHPRVDRELLQQYNRGLICSTACLSGEVPVHLLNDRIDEAAATVRDLQGIFGENNVFLEVMANSLRPQQTVNQGLFELSRQLSVPTIATTDCHYLTQDDFTTQDLMLCLQSHRNFDDPDRFKMDSNDFWVKSEDEMRAALPEFGDAIERTVEVAQRCHVRLDREDKSSYFSPAFPLPAGREELTETEYLRELVWEGIAERYDEVTDEIRQRVEYEIETIIDMGYAGYFLIVWDFIRYARKVGIGVGPGRGSAAGSIVAYALRITDVDPLRFDLIFERFLNPERRSMPDIDIDFDDRRRHEVIEYVTELYGREAVAQIATIGRIKAKNALRDVGRVLGVELSDVNRLASMIPDGPKASLAKALKKGDDLYDEDLVKESKKPEFQRLFEFALRLEGMARNTGVHAAGVVIGDRALVEHVPLLRTTNDEVATQFTMNQLEELGLLKMDFLGLKNLSIIEDCLIEVRAGGNTVDWEALDYKDDKAYELLRRGQTDGVFQVESDGMKNLLRDLQPECFEDIIAVLALYRPGPLNSGYTKKYVDAKNGRIQVAYEDPRMEPILRDTYGVIVYQEQVMLIANQLAGFSLGEADLLRKAMGKKNLEVMAKMRNQFVEGCVGNGMNRKVANDLFSNIEEFAEYCFNKSHTAAYAVLTFQTAYLKANYPREFMAALLTSAMNDTSSLLRYIRDAASLGLQILPPDVNHSGANFTPTSAGIRYGLAGIKGVGTGVVKAIIAEREQHGNYESIEDFCHRLGDTLNSKLGESLIRSGAFDSFGLRRAQAVDLFPRALETASNERKNAALYDGGGLFGAVAAEEEDVSLPLADLDEFPFAELLQWEKQLLGIYVSGHPVDPVRQDIELVATHRLDRLTQARQRSSIIVGGVLSEFKVRKFPSGDKRGEGLLEDGNGSCPLMIAENVLDACSDLLTEHALLMIVGTIDHRDDNTRIRVKYVYPVEEIFLQRINGVHVVLNAAELNPQHLQQTSRFLSRCNNERRNGSAAVLYFHLANNGNGTTIIRAGDSFTVPTDADSIQQLRSLLQPRSIRFDMPDGNGAPRRARTPATPAATPSPQPVGADNGPQLFSDPTEPQ